MEQKAYKAGSSAAVRAVVTCGVVAAITAVVSQISLPIGPVPISCSLIAVYLAGLLLPVKTAFLSQLVYLLLGAVGVPVFAGFQSGVARLAGPTGGYLVVFPFVSLLVAVMMLVYDRKLSQKSAFLRGSYMAAAMLLSLAVCYVVGTAWYMVYAGTSFVAALSLTALPFIPGDLAKIVLCAVLALSLRPRIRKILLRK